MLRKQSLINTGYWRYSSAFICGVRVGVVLPLTGDLAAYGNNAKDGIELAAQESNGPALGPQGISVRLLVEDSKGDPQTAVSSLQKLITIDRVSCVIGDVASSPTLAMAPIANQNRVVLLSPAASSPKITKAGEFIFRDWPSDDFEASGMAEYVKEKGYRETLNPTPQTVYLPVGFPQFAQKRPVTGCPQ
jgi:branched-chain amino acid transport system substrate-binding protein